MNRLLVTGEAPALVADTPAPGSKEHLRVQAKELGVASSGTKSEIWSRIAAKQGENVDRRIRSKPSQMAMASAPEPIDPAAPADGGNRLMRTMPAEDPMAGAASLQIPEGIPAPNPDGTPPQAAPAAPNGNFEAQLAELSAMLQQIGQAQAPGPVANARDSMAVAAAPPPPQRTWQDSQNRLLAR